MLRENRRIAFVSICMLMINTNVFSADAQVTTSFEKWSSRKVKESAIFGGKTKTLYDLPDHWATSNVHAQVMGADKAATSVYPANRDGRKVCRMQIEQISFTVCGVPVNAVAAGSIYLGESNEPHSLSDAATPMKVLNMNYAYTERPKELQLDYCTYIEQSTDISKANTSTSVKHYQGRDGAEIIVLLQHRWEDADGRIHAQRVATGWERIYTSSDAWVNNHCLPLRYGDITAQANYHSYEGLNAQGYMCRNSKGKMVSIEEEGYNANATPTHLIMMISSGCQPAYCGHVGNWIEVDNVCLK